MTATAPRIVWTAASPEDAATLQALFARKGWTSVLVESGAAAVDLLARESASLVILSEASERESVVDLCRRIRLEPNWNHVPVLVRLAAPTTEVVTSCLHSGADACLAVNVDIDVLRLRMRTLLRQTIEPSALSPWRDGRRLRVLVIDDDAIYLDLLGAELANDTHEVLRALDGETGLRLARLAPFDCAVIDRRLPGLDGLEVCRQIAAMRTEENWFPIAILTATDDLADRKVAFELGIDEFMLKLEGMLVIRARIAAILRRRAILTERRRIALTLVEHSAAAAAAKEQADSAARQGELIQQLAAVNRELIIARDDAVKAARSRAEFLANMSHELRTPLHAIIGTISSLDDALLTSGQSQEFGVLRASAEHLLSVINAILDFSKLDAGSAQLEQSEVDLGACVDGALFVVAPAANKKHLELICEIDPELPKFIKGDSGRLRQVLVNLVANAVKFTDRGEVRITLRTQHRPHAQVHLEVAVADTGPGISKSVQESLFSPFRQADASTSRVFGGTGLGLAIARKLVELMGGAIGVESTPGAGATFWFRIPITPSREGVLSEPTGADWGNQSFLIAYANARGRACYRKFIRSLGARAVGVASLAELEQELAREAPSILLLDESLHQGGIGPLLAAVRGLRPDLPILLFTSSSISARPGLLPVQKPVRAERLPGLIQQCRGVEQASPQAGHEQLISPAFAAAHPLRILAVEDNVVNRQILKKYMSRLGYTCDFATNGQEAIAAVLSTRYDLILLDVQMPGIDGLEVSRRVRGHYPRGALWICAMTAVTGHEERQRCIDAGMDDFLSKPAPIAAFREALLRAWQGKPATQPALQVGLVSEEPDQRLRQELERQGYVVSYYNGVHALAESRCADGLDAVLLPLDRPGTAELITRVRALSPSAQVVGITDLHTDRDGLAFLARQFGVDLALPRADAGAQLAAALVAPGAGPSQRLNKAIAAGVARLQTDLTALERSLHRLRATPQSRQELMSARALAHAIRGLAGAVGYPAVSAAVAEVEDELQRADAPTIMLSEPQLERLGAIVTLTRKTAWSA